MKEFYHSVNNKDLKIKYEPTPKRALYDAMYFHVFESDVHKFSFTIKISGSMKAIQINQGKITEENYEEIITLIFIEYVKKKLEEGQNSDYEFMFSSSNREIFDGFYNMIQRPTSDAATRDKKVILNYLYKTHY